MDLAGAQLFNGGLTIQVLLDFSQAGELDLILRLIERDERGTSVRSIVVVLLK